MNDTQSIISLILQTIIGISAAVAAYYGFKNHAIGQSNAVKIDQVQETAVTKDAVAQVQRTASVTKDAIETHAVVAQISSAAIIHTLAEGMIPVDIPPQAPEGAQP